MFVGRWIKRLRARMKDRHSCLLQLHAALDGGPGTQEALER